MNARITKCLGEYVLKYRSTDINELRRIGAIVRSKTGYDFRDAVY